MHTFLSNIAHRQRQTDKQTGKRTRAKTYTSSFVGGKQRFANTVSRAHFFTRHLYYLSQCITLKESLRAFYETFRPRAVFLAAAGLWEHI